MRHFFVVFCALLLLAAATLRADNVQTETEYYAVLVDGQKMGHAIFTRQAAEGIVSTTEELNLVIARGEITMAVSSVETSIETTAGKAIGFENKFSFGGMVQQVTGKINSQGKIEVSTTAGGTSHQQVIDFPAGALMSEGLRLLELKKGLAEGTTYEATLFSPAVLVPVKIKISIGATMNVDLLGKVVPLTEVTSLMQLPTGEMNAVSYVDKELKARKMIAPMMGSTLELIACDKTFALSENDIVDFLGDMLLQSPTVIKDIDLKSSATYYLSPKKGAKLTIPSTDSQTTKKTPDGMIVITVNKVAGPEGVKFPYKGKDEKLLKELKPTRYLQCDDGKIKELTKHAVAGAKDAGQAVKQIESFVNGYITAKDLSIGYASAAQVAQSRQGDCSEHALLTAAICRAAGIPARVATGLVYVEEFAGKKNVYGGHAWTQAYVGDKWIDLDATRAPNGFGPGHITLATGNGEQADFFGMISTLGYFKIEKIIIKD